MIINKIAVGNKDEAFVEDRLKNGINIIFSQDNNKGKTIIIQSALYALGNEPIFPASFEYRNFYHYINLTLDDGKQLLCCRHNDDFFVKHENEMFLLNGVAELKRKLNKIGIRFPNIIKDNKEKMVDPVLLYQVFFVGQDGNKTSNIVKQGYYSKNDFMEMIYSLKGVDVSTNDDLDNSISPEEEIKRLKSRKEVIIKEKDIFVQKNNSTAISSPSIDLNKINDIRKKTEEITNEITSLSKERNRFLNKLNNAKSVLEQLNSLKTRINGMKLQCADCGSNNIELVSETEGFRFDVSDSVTRNDIETTINEKIESYNEEIEKRTIEINKLQKKIQDIIDENNNVNYDEVLFYAYLINENKDYDKELLEIDKRIEELKTSINSKNAHSDELKTRKEEIKKSIIDKMNEINKTIDPSSNNELDIFTKQDVTYSGCEEAIYYLSRLYALQHCLNHNYPLIMDHFRAGELSSTKEKIVLDLYKELSNQVIFTVTLKNEESNKYIGNRTINAINYEINNSNHVLNKDDVIRFESLLSIFKISI